MPDAPPSGPGSSVRLPAPGSNPPLPLALPCIAWNAPYKKNGPNVGPAAAGDWRRAAKGLLAPDGGVEAYLNTLLPGGVYGGGPPKLCSNETLPPLMVTRRFVENEPTVSRPETGSNEPR